VLGLQGDALAQVLGDDNKFLAGKTAPLAKAVQDDFLKQLGKEAAQQPGAAATLLLGGKTEGGESGPDFTSLVPAMMANMDKALAANAETAQGQGGQYWDYFEVGLIDRATKSGALAKAVNAMVDSSLNAKLPGYQPS
jgi:hypothetical protein